METPGNPRSQGTPARVAELAPEEAARRPVDRQRAALGAVATFARHHCIDFILAAFAASLYVVDCLYLRGFDEVENLLGGRLIASGQWPYSGFFSHHMPGMYLLAALLHPVTGNNLFYFRLAFNLLLLCVLLANAALLRRLIGRFSARIYLAVLPLAHLAGFGQMALAESLVAHVFMTALILALFSAPQRLFRRRGLILVSVLLFLVPLFSLSYVFAAAVLYLLLSVRYCRAHRPLTIRGSATALTTLGAPYLVAFVVLVITGSLHRFIFDILTFNSTYYAPLVGQTGGSVVDTLLETVRNSTEQLATLARHLVDPTYTVQALHVLGYLLLGLVLWQQKRRIDALLIITLLLVVDPLVNIFNPPALVTPLAGRTQHSIMFTSVALTAACMAIPLLWQQWPARRRLAVAAVRAPVVAYLAVVTVSLLSFNSAALSPLLVRHESPTLYDIAKELPNDFETSIMNQLTSSEDYAWIGPADFESQLYMSARRSSAFTFFMPWQDSCAKCREELLTDFATQQPKVIVWGEYYYQGAPYTYNREITQFFDTEYFQARDPRLKSFHFLKRDSAILTERLTALGYVV